MSELIAEITERLNAEKVRRRKAIGERIRAERKKRDYSLKFLSEKLTEHGHQISLSQLSRIETGEVAIDDDLRIVLSEVLGVSENTFYGALSTEPWFITRWRLARRHLDEVLAKVRINESAGSAHKNLIDLGIYRYVPLVPEMEGENPNDKPEVKMEEPKMQKFLVQVMKAEIDVMTKIGLAQHEGEEILYVIKGRMNFWYKQPDSLEVHSRELDEGDVVHFSSMLFHGFSAPTDEPALALFIFSNVHVSPTPQLVLEKPNPVATLLQ